MSDTKLDAETVTITDISTPVNYLDLLDEEQRSRFTEGHHCFYGFEPLMVQLIIDIRKLREAMLKR